MGIRIYTIYVSKGNYWDNSPQESLYRHMKDEIADTLAGSKSFEEVKKTVDDWMDYYRYDRYHWNLQTLSPHEYYQYLITGVYPLKKGVSKNSASRDSVSLPEV